MKKEVFAVFRVVLYAWEAAFGRAGKAGARRRSRFRGWPEGSGKTLFLMKIVVLLLYVLLALAGQGYVSWRTWQLLPAILPLRVAVVGMMTAAFLTFFLVMGGVGEKFSLPVGTFLYEVGMSWPFVLLYLALFYGLAYLLALAHVLPPAWCKASLAGTLGVLAVMTVLFGYGYLRFEHKVRVPLTLQSGGKMARPLRVVMVSDLHLGYHNRRADLRRWLQMIMREKPDALLIGGDIIDRAVRPVRLEQSAEEFRSLGIPVYAVLGNHDHYAGVDSVVRFCADAGITLLRDSVAMLGEVAIVGRDDRTNGARKPLAKLMAGVDKGKYVVLLDHQPHRLDEAQRAGVDFEFAGHTHRGQVWPISWVTDAIYEKSHGALTKGDTRYWVSSGLGIWGGKFRIGTQSEYIVATIR